jgi:hypothetical protein
MAREGAGFEAVAAAAADMSPDLVGRIWGGYASAWSGDLSDPAALAADLKAHVPAIWQSTLRDNALRRATIAGGGDPEPTLAFAASFSAALEVENVRDGIRLGFESLFAETPEAGIARAADWPDAEAAAIYEILGWSAATRAGDTRDHVLSLVQTVPEAHRCGFSHGAVRRLASRRPFDTAADWESLRERVAALGAACHATNFRAVGLALLQREKNGDETEDTARRLALIDDAAERALVQAAVTAGRGDAPEPAWSMPKPSTDEEAQGPPPSPPDGEPRDPDPGAPGEVEPAPPVEEAEPPE